MEKKPYYVYSNNVAEEQYKHCIQKLAEVLTESYRVWECSMLWIKIFYFYFIYFIFFIFFSLSKIYKYKIWKI